MGKWQRWERFAVLSIRTTMRIRNSLFILLLFANIAYANQINYINSVSELNSIADNTQVSAPYSILSNTNYTPDMKVYVHDNHKLQILNNENPDQINFRITKHLQMKPQKYEAKNLNTRLPWWSPLAPPELKNLDFSKMDGTADVYQIGENYQLRLLPKQGNWGKTYLLERKPKDIKSNATIICVVKLLLTRSDRNMSREEFHQRHRKEIMNNLLLANLNFNIAIKTFGIIENDADHYLMFLEYGENARDRFKQQSLDKTIDEITDFIKNVNTIHLSGYAHGDLHIGNMLYINDTIKLCDWFSLKDLKNTLVKEYRYIGDNLPPEAMRAFYFGKNDESLKYSIVEYKEKKRSYWLHPIAADRFCLGISLLEIFAPDLHKKFDNLFPKNFNPYKPESLDFWIKCVSYIHETQAELLKRAAKTDDRKKRALLEQLAKFIDVDPLNRVLSFQFASSMQK